MQSPSKRASSNSSTGRPRSLRWLSGGAALAVCAVLGSYHGSEKSSATPNAYTVTIENMKFNPSVVKMHSGDSVTFKNQDILPHTVTKTGVLDSGMIKAGESWTYTAQKEGSIHYACSYHPVMEGTIEVEK